MQTRRLGRTEIHTSLVHCPLFDAVTLSHASRLTVRY